MTIILFLWGGDKMVDEKDLGLSPLVKHQNYNQLLKNHRQKRLKPIKKDILHSKMKKKTQQDGRRGCFPNIIKSCNHWVGNN